MEYNIEKLKYDLALIYAKSKLDHAIATDSVPESETAKEHGQSSEIEYLANMFYEAVGQFAEYDASMFPDKSDF